MKTTKLAALLSLFGAVVGCGDTPPDPVICEAIGIPSIVAEVRDERGFPSAIGATLTAVGRDAVLTGHGFGDSLRIFTGDPFRVTGKFQVSVEKPWYHGAQIDEVKVPGGPCGVEEPYRVRLVIELRSDAPPIRQVVLPPSDYGFGDGNISASIPAFVESAEDVSQEVRWRSSDSTVVSVTQMGTITSQCLERPDSAWVVPWSVVDPNVRITDSVMVWVSSMDPNSDRCS